MEQKYKCDWCLYLVTHMELWHKDYDSGLCSLECIKEAEQSDLFDKKLININS